MSGKFEAEVWGYVNGVISGDIPACKELKQIAKRYADDYVSGRWEYRTTEADYVIDKIQTQFVHRQGEDLEGQPLKGKPFILEPWEKFIIYGILVFYKPGTIVRRIHEAFVFIPRKNGKTLFVAALAWGLALLSVLSGAKIYIVAASLKQAMESYDNIENNLCRNLYESKKEAQEEGWRILDNNMEHSISHMDIGGGSLEIQALASNPDAQDSLNCNIAICDELHAYKTPKQYNVIREATKAYTNKLVIGITTAGDGGRNTFCARRLKMCQNILNSTTKDTYAEQLFIFICKADEMDNGDVDFTNPAEHIKANPNMGVSIKPDDMMAAALEALNDPQQRKDFLQKSLNIFVSNSKSYFDVTEFEMSDKQYSWTMEDLAKLPIKWFGGTDLSRVHDLTAACLYGTYKDVDIVIPHCWFPIATAYKKADEDGIPLFGWQDDGWLTMCNGKTVNHIDVVKWFCAMRKMGFKIVQIGQDRKFAREFFAAMKKEKFKVVDQPQYYYVKSEGFRHIEQKAKNGLLYYMHADPYLYCVENVHAIEKTDDMVQYDKIDDNSRIDIFDASVFACIRMILTAERDERLRDNT